MKKEGISLMTFILIVVLLFLLTICGVLLYMDINIQPAKTEKTASTTQNAMKANNKVENEIIVQETVPVNTSIEGQYDHDEYQKKIDEISEKYEAMGVSVALCDDGKVIDTFSYGDAIEDELKMTEDSKVRIASISKIFVGLATMISVENGTMSLDEDIGTYWGFKLGYSADDDVITARSILTHTSSLYDSEDPDDTYYDYTVDLLRTGDGIRYMTSGNIENYCYNNFAMDVLGMTVELANNKILDEILAERLYDKLGIDASFYGGDLKDKSQVATAYQSDWSIGITGERNCYWHSEGPGEVGWGFAGSLTISAKDLCKIVALLANDGVYDGTRYIAESSIKEMEKHKNNYVDGFWQCQPLFYQTNIYGQDEFYYHTGGAYGIYSLAGYNPNTKQGVAILTSGASWEDDENEITKICGEIANVLLNIKQ